MRKILDYLRLLVFAGSVLVGLQVPGFIDQYGNSLEAHLAESSLGLDEFQQDAERYFDGSLDQLIAHYKNSPDPVIRDGGLSLSAIYSRNLILTRAWMAFNTSTYSAYTHVIFAPLNTIKNKVWSNYTYSILLDQSAIISGLSCGLALSLLLDLSALLIGLMAQQLWRRVQ